MAHRTLLSLLQQLHAEDPQLTDQEGTRRMIVAVLGVSLVIDLLMIGLGINPELMAIYGILICIVLIPALRGSLTPAKIAIPLGGLLMMEYLIFINNGLRDMAMLGLPLVVIVASLLLGRWGAVIYGFLTLLLVTALWIAETSGMVSNAFSTHNTGMDYIAAGIAIGLVIVLQWLLIRRLNDNITKARRNEKAQMLANDALRISEAQFRALVEESPDGILIASPEGKIVLINPTASKILGYESNELIGVEVMSLIAHEASSPHPEHIEQLMSGQTVETDLIFTKKDGDRVPTLGSNRRMPDGRLQYTFRDISKQKEIEAEREKLIRELETKNAELERFTYTVSHDLKSPLVTIRGYLGYVERDATEGNPFKLQKDIQRIVGATEKMQRLLNELLEFSRVGRVVNPPVETSFEGVVQEAEELVQGRLEESKTRVVIQSRLPTVRGDHARLVEVMQNLLDNAAKFMGKQGNPRVEIGMQSINHESVFYVRDNGIGIAPEHHERVFGLFNKLDPTVEGTGVGLALVKRIIEMHGGRIWIESDGKGNGTTFYFTLKNTNSL